MNWIDKTIDRLFEPRGFTWTGLVVAALAIAGLYALAVGLS